MVNSDANFSWINTHNELVRYLATMEDKQSDLLGILKGLDISALNDQNPEGVQIDLEEIDPFTFFCYIYKHGPVKRLELLQKIAQQLKLTIPHDEKGIPSSQAQKVWLFPWKYLRTHNEIKRLWSFFRDAINNSITNEAFEDVLQIKNVGKTKLTEALFYILPEKYLPINGPTQPYIKEVLGINPEFTKS